MVPELGNPIRLSRMFGVSLDESGGPPATEETRKFFIEQSKISPRLQPDERVGQLTPRILRTEYRQAMEEGKDVETYRELFDSVAKMPSGLEKKEIADILFNMVMKAPMRADYIDNEPSDLEGIRLLRRGETPKLPSSRQGGTGGIGCWARGRAASADAFWASRWKPGSGRSCSPCSRPAETGPCIAISALPTWPRIRKTNAGPIRWTACPWTTTPIIRCWRECFWTKYGRDFTPENVASVWMDYQPRRAYCTAERVAYTNFMRGDTPPRFRGVSQSLIGNGSARRFAGIIMDISIPETRVAAADMAFRDASISHIKNGIYGEMFVSLAMLAQGGGGTEHGTGHSRGPCPDSCRQPAARGGLRRNRRDGKRAFPPRSASLKFTSASTKTSWHDWCHVISNAMVVTAALLYGEGDYGKTVCLGGTHRF